MKAFTSILDIIANGAGVPNLVKLAQMVTFPKVIGAHGEIRPEARDFTFVSNLVQLCIIAMCGNVGELVQFSR